MSQFLILLLRFLVPLLTAALVMLAFNTFFIDLLLVLLLKLSITFGALSRALLERFLVRFFAALQVMIIFAAVFPNGNNLFMTGTVPYPFASQVRLCTFFFICGGNLDLHILSYLATNVLPLCRVTCLGVALFIIT